MPDTMIERVARVLWDEQRDAMKGNEPDGWLKGALWDMVACEDVTKDVAAQMRSAARAAIAALMEPTDGMVDAADRAMYGRVVEGERRIPVIRDGLRAALTAALKETPDADRR
jgi:hypothetical protein